MLIPQIAQNLRTILQLRILFPLIPPPILNPTIPLQCRTRHNSQNRQTQPRPKPRLIPRALIRDENITAYQIPAIAKSDHKPRRESRFGVSAHVIRDPDHEERHLDIGRCRDSEHAEISCSDRLQWDGEFDGPPDDTKDGAEEEEAISVVQLARKIGAGGEREESHDVDGDGVDLGFGGGVAEGFEDGGLEGDG